MHTDLLLSIRFRASSLIRSRPSFSLALVSSLLVSLLALITYSSLLKSLADAEDSQHELTAAPMELVVTSPRNASYVPLRPFNSAEVIQALNDAASATNLPINGVAFSLEETPAQPYLRYRASLIIVGDYLSTRRFVKAVHTTLIDVSLDSFSCTRKNIRDAGLECAVTFSAFYRKDGDE